MIKKLVSKIRLKKMQESKSLFWRWIEYRKKIRNCELDLKKLGSKPINSYTMLDCENLYKLAKRQQDILNQKI